MINPSSASSSGQFYRDRTTSHRLSGLSHLDCFAWTKKIISIFRDFAKTHASPNTEGNTINCRLVVISSAFEQLENENNLIKIIDAMNKEYMIYNLREALEQLISTIDKLETDENYEKEAYFVEMQHLYHHINTAWNARDSTKEESIECSESNFEKWRQFPTDIYMGI